MTEFTKGIEIARLDCLMFIYLILDGWGTVHKTPSGAKIAVNSPLSQMRRLGYPTRHRLTMASKRVRQTCPQEAEQYKQLFREFLEARRRWLATETEESWSWYRHGRGNRNSVAYRTKVDLSHRGGWAHFRTRRGFKYMVHGLLPRLEERRRADDEIDVALKKLAQVREAIFEKMGVPVEIRSLVPPDNPVAEKLVLQFLMVCMPELQQKLQLRGNQ